MSTADTAGGAGQPAGAASGGVRTGGRSARVSAAVINATLELLASEGVTGVSIGDVAARSGVHRTSIYRRWGTKEALILAALKAHAAGAVMPPDLGTLRADLDVLVRDAAAMLSDPASLRVIRGLVALSDREGAEGRRSYWGERLANHRVVIERAVERGELPPTVRASEFLELLIAPLWMRLVVIGGQIDDALLERSVSAALAAFGSVD